MWLLEFLAVRSAILATAWLLVQRRPGSVQISRNHSVAWRHVIINLTVVCVQVHRQSMLQDEEQRPQTGALWHSVQNWLDWRKLTIEQTPLDESTQSQRTSTTQKPRRWRRSFDVVCAAAAHDLHLQTLLTDQERPISVAALIVTLDVSPTVFEKLTFKSCLSHPSIVWRPRSVEPVRISRWNL